VTVGRGEQQQQPPQDPQRGGFSVTWKTSCQTPGRHQPEESPNPNSQMEATTTDPQILYPVSSRAKHHHTAKLLFYKYRGWATYRQIKKTT